jgi:hypothetical protein
MAKQEFHRKRAAEAVSMASAIFSPLRLGGRVRGQPRGPTLKSGGGVSNQNDCTHKSASVF